MQIKYLTLIAVSLAMDAFGVTLSISLNNKISKKRIMLYILSFSFFQFLFTLIGSTSGYLFDTYIAAIPNLAGGIVMILIGIFMIIDGIKRKESSILLKTSTSLILGISVSIDALVVGFSSFYNLGHILLIFIDSIFIGLVTLFICLLGFFLCRVIKKINIIAKFSDFLGGTALILFGLKMLFL